MMLPHDAVVALADGEHLKLFRNAGTDAAPDLSPLPSPTLKSAGHPSGGRHRSSAANPDDRRLEEDGYAAAVAHWLNRESAEGRIGRLMVIAPARTLGELRHHYDRQLQGKLLGEISKDLIGVSAAAISAAIAAH